MLRLRGTLTDRHAEARAVSPHFLVLRLDLDGLGESLKQFDASQGRDPAALRLV